MIEGGLSGTVNLNTRKPFDQDGMLFSFDIEANYGDMAKKWSPTVSALFSDNWDTGIGRVGLLADYSYSQIYSRADGLRSEEHTSELQSLMRISSAVFCLTKKIKPPERH